jgi:catechol 2,3-dioxygenase-like lactoylglutathione lyase family enzyme
MLRGLDHIVHAVRDLDAVVELYRRLGFQVGARNVHPRSWGTQNHIIQLPGTFIELLAVADNSGIVPQAPHHFSFGAFNRNFLSREQGLSMLVLEGRGAPDADEFRARGIGDYELFEFEREGKRPDGTPIKVAFALAFASDPHMPHTGFFSCLHRRPENFWNPAFQKHANGAETVAGVVLVAEQPSRHRDFLLAFSGVQNSRNTGDGFTIDLPRGAIEMTTPAALERRFGLPAPDVTRGARLAALRFSGRALVAGCQSVLGAVLVLETAR